jgi:hypothetical protein
MEDLFKILIWVIIIISFVSSFFKKRKKEGSKTPQIPNRDNQIMIPEKAETHNKPAENKDEIDSYNDMLSEIENLFKKDEQPGKSKKENDTLKKADQYDPQWHKETASEHTSITDWRSEEKALEKKAAVDFNIENKAKKFEEIINQKSEPIGIFKHTIKEKLRHPETLKDYILMSEIIGKPACRTGRAKAKRR